MGVHIGRDGVVKVGGVDIAELRSFSIEETGDTVEDTVMTDTARTFVPTLTSFSGSADVYWDETDAGQAALVLNTPVQMKFYPEGATGTVKYYQGEAIVTGVSRSASFDGMVEASITFQGTGALTAAGS
tara:strand:+ start:118 stop:504 length:387 start_codon:yes stop_codon:yes gene_type:complete